MMRRRALTAISVLATAGVGVGGAFTLSAAAKRADTEPQLFAEPAEVQPGDTLVLRGRGFPKRVQIALFAGPPSNSTRIGSAESGRRGGFSAPIRVRMPADPHRYVVRACHDACRVTATSTFRVVEP